MGQQQSKDELLYQQANSGNIEGIKALRSDGAALEVIHQRSSPFYFFGCYNSLLVCVLCINCIKVSVCVCVCAIYMNIMYLRIVLFTNWFELISARLSLLSEASITEAS